MSNPLYERSVDNSCPHDGWYNGNPNLMIQNGTYADYRYKLEGYVAKGKMKQADLDKYDERWKEIALEVKRARRTKVIEDTTPHPQKLRDGKIEMVAKPSDNGIRYADAQLRKPLRARMPIGSIANRPDPLALEEMAAKSAAAGVVGEAGIKGKEVPLFVPDPAKVPVLNVKHAVVA